MQLEVTCIGKVIYFYTYKSFLIFQIMMRPFCIWIALNLIIILTVGQTSSFQLIITDINMVKSQSDLSVYSKGVLTHIYNDTIYNTGTNCRNGDLIILNNAFLNHLSLAYSGFDTLNDTNTYINQLPNKEPKPTLSFGPNIITINFNCPTQPDDANYFNKVQLYLPGTYHASFLLNCDPTSRHKPFQFGYLIISVINAAIIVGVAMFSHVWSITWKSHPLKLELKWIPFAIFNVASIALLFGLYGFAINDFSNAFLALRYFGIGISSIFVFICFNEAFFLWNQLKTQVYKIFRICDLLSITFTAALIAVASLFQSWILYNSLAICICVGSIKLLHFNTLKQAFISMSIYVGNVTTIAIILHFILPISYNDQASQLASPLFIQVPDLINNLYKKCSWLVVADVIVPGVTLSYLRQYDENRSSRYGGVYTVWGNITFVLSTILWVGLEAIYPFSIPFSLVTYLSLMLAIFIIAWKRNDWKTLVQGTFQKSGSTLKNEFLQEKSQRFSKLMQDEVFSPLKKSIGKQSKPDGSRDSQQY